MRLAFIFLWLCLIQPCQSAIPNFAWVDKENHICRGGQPTAADLVWLKSQGVTNDIKLNLGKDKAPKGVKVIKIPINFCDQLLGGKSLERKLNLATVLIRPGTFVHCSHGANRTGTVLIAFRVKALFWGKHVAKWEARELGWGNSLPGLKAYVKRLK